MSDRLRGKKLSGNLKGRVVGMLAVYSLGNITSFTTKQEVEKDTLPSTGRGDYGQALESDNVSKPTEIAFNFNTFNKEGMARTLMGEAVDLPTIPKSITDEEHVVIYGGEFKLVHDDIDPDNFAIKKAQGAVVPKAHYELNPRIGTVAFNDDCTLSAGDDIEVTYKTKATEGFKVDANTLQSYRLELWLDGKDRITEKNYSLHMPHVVLSADGDTDWMASDWWESGLTGIVVTEEGKQGMTYKEFD